jgi:hypothetical protein
MRGLVRSVATALVLYMAGATGALADPPARVGRLSLIEGDVTFHDTATREAGPATLNWPVTSGAALSTAPDARAEVRIGSTAIRLDGATALEFVQLDDQSIRLRVEYGAVAVRVRSREVADELVLETRDARVSLSEAGSYRIEAGRAPDTTAVTAFQGAAHVDADGIAVAVKPGRRAEVGSGGRARVVEASADAFDAWTLSRDRADEVAQTTRYVSPETTGYESLDAHGDWREATGYGPVWYPRAVPAGWAPYRAGRWAWVEPWGWTWIDEAPWGFAPFHYGRWALIGGHWGWVPGAVVARPVYAPALVGWVGRPGWSVTIAVGSVAAVGWFPLAPREVFVPAYRCSTAYVRNVNVTHVTNVVNITNVTPTRYAHRHVERAVTVVPAAAVSGGAPVGRSAVRVRHADLVADAGGTNAPPANAGRPPRQFGNPRRDEDGRWSRGAQAVPAANAPAPPLAIERDRRRDEPRAERERPAPTQPAATAPVPPVAGERVRRRDEPDRRDERERPVPTPAPPAVSAPVPPVAVERDRRRDDADRRLEPRVERERGVPSPVPPVATTPAQPRVVAPQAQREQAERRDGPRPAIVPSAPRAAVPTPTPAATVRTPAPVPASPPQVRAPAPVQASPLQMRTPAPVQAAPPQVRVPAPVQAAPTRVQMPAPVQAAPPQVRAPNAGVPPQGQPTPRSEGNRGQPREARQGERRGG